MSHPPRVQVILATFAVLAGATVLYAQPTPVPTPLCMASPQTFTATGSAQQYVVPAGASAVYIVANGAAGGDVSGAESHTGGFGAHIAAQVPSPAAPRSSSSWGRAAATAAATGPAVAAAPSCSPRPAPSW